MPIYAYLCESCGFAKDALQKMSDAPLTVCPQCGRETFKKQVTAAGFQLKGSGWYVTDFRGNGQAPAAKKSDGASESTGTNEAASSGSGEKGQGGNSGSGEAGTGGSSGEGGGKSGSSGGGSSGAGGNAAASPASSGTSSTSASPATNGKPAAPSSGTPK